MKFCTKEWYEEMQIAGIMCIYETEEEWEEYLAYFRSEGKDPLQSQRELLEEKKEHLLKYLPEAFHPYIHDGTLNTIYPPPELKEMAKQWKQDYDDRMRKVAETYNRYYKSIQNELPPNAIKLFENTLHDAKFTSYDRPDEATFFLYLDCRGSYSYFTDIKITFHGVKQLELPDLPENTWWLYDEIYTIDGGFEIRVLLDSLEAFIISAVDVEIEVLGELQSQ
ncbi:DUF4085 family protein [Paenibacillus sp. FSL H8-0537]|uniref:DUF4085 family protein n=1 Tax=Paenibacillus sp. FSL H8-0537 TaxID=2921399 RepID=UPI003101363A